MLHGKEPHSSSSVRMDKRFLCAHMVDHSQSHPDPAESGTHSLGSGAPGAGQYATLHRASNEPALTE